MNDAPVAEQPVRLSSVEDWAQRWQPEQAGRDVRFNPLAPEFIDLHKAFKAYVPKAKPAAQCVEIGAYPGRYLWYFQSHYGYNPCGVEYVPECAAQLQRNLTSSGVRDAEVIARIFLTCHRPCPDVTGIWL